MAWSRISEKPLSDPMMVNLLTHICVTRPQWVNTCPFPDFHCGLNIPPLKIGLGRFITSHKAWLLQFEYTLNWLTYFVLLFPIDAILTLSNHTCYHLSSWWRHQMETFSALLAIYAGNSPVTGEFPAQKTVARNFDVFFDVCLNKRLSKQWCGWWFETPWRPLWRHCNMIFVSKRGHREVKNYITSDTWYIKRM